MAIRASRGAGCPERNHALRVTALSFQGGCDVQGWSMGGVFCSRHRRPTLRSPSRSTTKSLSIAPSSPARQRPPTLHSPPTAARSSRRKAARCSCDAPMVSCLHWRIRSAAAWIRPQRKACSAWLRIPKSRPTVGSTCMSRMGRAAISIAFIVRR